MKMSSASGLALAIVLAACSAQQQNQAQSQAQQIASAAPGVATDAYVAAAVEAKLVAVDLNAASEVKVSASNGAVALSGKVRDSGERARYLAAAQSVNGVASVSDRLTIDTHLQGLAQQAADVAIEARVTAAIAAQAGANVFHVTPNTRGAIVTLKGRVSSSAVDRTIEAAVRGVSGVKAVVDQIDVR